MVRIPVEAGNFLFAKAFKSGPVAQPVFYRLGPDLFPKETAARK
jgi:hypothetical protein